MSAYENLSNEGVGEQQITPPCRYQLQHYGKSIHKYVLDSEHIVPAMTSNDSKPLEVGDAAPDFVLPSTEGESVQLLSLVGSPIVLFFLTDTFTFYSRGFSKIFESLHDSLRIVEVTVVGVSTEPIETLCTFVDEWNIPYILLSDFNREVVSAYGTLAERISGLTMVTRAGVFVIDKEGKIAYKWIHDEQSPAPNADQIVELISKIQSESGR